MKQSGFLDVEERLAWLTGLGDQLEGYSRIVNFEVFCPDLDTALAYSDGSKGGRPPFDPVQIIQILVIQTLTNPPDERTEYLINDRLSFMCFLGLGLLAVCLILKRSGCFASVCPQQRTTNTEKVDLRAGRIPKEW